LGNGLYTCFFSAYDITGEFESIGKATFRVKEQALVAGAGRENIK
jgi:hypothetical protein